MTESAEAARIRRAIAAVGAVISLALLAVCAIWLSVVVADIQQRAARTWGDLGAVLLAFGLAVAFASPLLLRLSPIGRPRMTTAVVASVLIASSWIGGLSLNSGK